MISSTRSSGRLGRLLALGFVACLPLASGCQGLIGAAKQQIKKQAQKAAPGGTTRQPGQSQQPPAIEVSSVTPAQGSIAGGDSVTIAGSGFGSDATVAFGTVALPPSSVTVVDDSTIQCTTPAYPSAGAVTVTVMMGQGMGQRAQGFVYYEPVSITAVSPDLGPRVGGTVLTITGTGFIDGTQVSFASTGSNPTAGTIPPITASLEGLHSLDIYTPTLPRGTYDVTVTNGDGTDTAKAAFTTYGRLQLQSVTPFAGPMTGGTSIAATGQGFFAPTQLEVGTQNVDSTPNSTETELDASTPAASAEGAVDVTVTNDLTSLAADAASPSAQAATLAGGFVYYDANDTTPRVVAVTPPTGVLQGGTQVGVVIAGMGDPSAATVYFGGTAATCSAVDTNSLSCATPSGSAAGPVDVRVVDGTGDETLASGFTYVSLSIDSLQPNRGGLAGGTWVQMVGGGFADGARVVVGTRLATDVNVVDANHLTFYTPPNAAGPVAVQVFSQGAEVGQDNAFTYFDPTDSVHRSSGGSVDGAVNVTVLDAGGLALPRAFVMLGSHATDSHLYGRTDPNGEIVLSGPSVTGPQSIHAGKEGYSAESMLQVDAQNIRLVLHQLPSMSVDHLPPCPQSAGGEPPLIRGHVYRIKDQYNTGNDTVVVTTTFSDPSTPLPLPGSDNVITNQGDYQLFARTGDMVVVALAGTVMPDNTLDVHAMGFHPFVNTQSSTGASCSADSDCTAPEKCVDFNSQGFCLQVYDNVDIVVDTPLDQPMTVHLDKPPVFNPAGGAPPTVPATFDAAPVTTSVSVWLNFGYMGYFPMMAYPLGPYNPMIGVQVSPTQLPAADTVPFNMPHGLPDAVGRVTFDVQGGVSGTGSLQDATSSVSSLTGLQFPQSDVTLTPMLQVRQDTQPGVGGTLPSDDPMSFATKLWPTDSTAPLATASINYMYQVQSVPACMQPTGPQGSPQAVIYWTALAPGSCSSFDLPRFPDSASGARLPPKSQFSWQISDTYSSQTRFDNLDLNLLYQGPSSALRSTGFQTP